MSNVVALPSGGSRILTQFVAARESERRQRRAAEEQRQAQADFRRLGGRTAVARATVGAMRDLPRPAFERVSGQRAALTPAAESRAFAAAATDRLTAGWTVASTGINADLEGALEELRARSRDWSMNTDMGRRYVSLVQDNVIGSTAPRLQVRATLASGAQDEAANQAVESAWAKWCERGFCEITGELDFAAVCRTVIAADARDGEHLVRKVVDRSLPHGFALQLLDVDRIRTKSTAALSAGSNTIRMGVEIDRLGRKVALHLHSAHPGDSGSPLAPKPMADRVPADQLLHGFVLERPEQLRGYPWASAVLLSADQLAQYKRYALVAAKIGAAKMGFYVTDKDAYTGEQPSFEDIKDATGSLVQDVEAGMLEALPPGVSFEGWDPAYPHQHFNEFVLGHERGIAAGLNVAHHNLTGNMNGVNYSSARIAELAERQHWRRLQQWFIQCFVRPVFGEWLRAALLMGVVRLPSGQPLPAERWQKFFDASTFQPRGWAWVDPQADIDAAVTAVTNDMRSLRQISDETGVDLFETLQDKLLLREWYLKNDLPLPPYLGGQPAAPAAATTEPAAA